MAPRQRQRALQARVDSKPFADHAENANQACAKYFAGR
jgi:hypothetical protein